ncbi:MAG: HU family DNA-binding protein [Syntrophobacteraceae bacterium]
MRCSEWGTVVQEGFKRNGGNHRTGKPITLPSGKVVTFNCSKFCGP